jgi:hypothetical protein
MRVDELATARFRVAVASSQGSFAFVVPFTFAEPFALDGIGGRYPGGPGRVVSHVQWAR